MLASVNTETGKIDSALYIANAKGIIVDGESKEKYIIATTENIIQADAITKKIIKNLPLTINRGRLFFSRTVKQDLQGNFWIGGDAALFLYNPVANTIKTIEANVSNFSAKKINTKRLYLLSVSSGWVLILLYVKNWKQKE